MLLLCVHDDVDNGDDVADTEEDVHDPETEPGPWHHGVVELWHHQQHLWPAGQLPSGPRQDTPPGQRSVCRS